MKLWLGLRILRGRLDVSSAVGSVYNGVAEGLDWIRLCSIELVSVPRVVGIDVRSDA